MDSIIKTFNGRTNFYTIITEYTVNYSTFPELLASFIIIRNLFFKFIPILLNTWFGYFNGNYYYEVINSLFKENDELYFANKRNNLRTYETKPIKVNSNKSINDYKDNNPKKEKFIK